MIRVTYWSSYCDAGDPPRNLTLRNVPLRDTVRAVINSARVEYALQKERA